MDSSAKHLSITASEDTLIFTNEFYLPQSKLARESDGHLDIKMLRRSYQNSVDYLPELSDPLVFDLLGGDPSRTNLSDVTSIKLIYDMERDRMYYQNTLKYMKNNKN